MCARRRRAGAYVRNASEQEGDGRGGGIADGSEIVVGEDGAEVVQ
jgi:hypothetical protein